MTLIVNGLFEENLCRQRNQAEETRRWLSGGRARHHAVYVLHFTAFTRDTHENSEEIT